MTDHIAEDPTPNEMRRLNRTSTYVLRSTSLSARPRPLASSRPYAAVGGGWTLWLGDARSFKTRAGAERHVAKRITDGVWSSKTVDIIHIVR